MWNLICRRFRNPCLFHLHIWCEQETFVHTTYEIGTDNVPKRRKIKFRRWGLPKGKNKTLKTLRKFKSILERPVSSIRCKAHNRSTWMMTGCKASSFLTSCLCACYILDLSELCLGDMAPVQSNAVGSLRSPPPRRLPIIAGRTRYGKTRILFVFLF